MASYGPQILVLLLLLLVLMQLGFPKICGVLEGNCMLTVPIPVDIFVPQSYVPWLGMDPLKP